MDVKRFLIGFMVLVFVISFGRVGFADEKEKPNFKSKIDQSVQVKLPDGLYLFHKKHITAFEHNQQTQDGIFSDKFSPLFIVEKGRLIDPYILANKIGITKFNDKYVKGKVFSVYNGSELIGTLSNLELVSEKKSPKTICDSEQVLPDIHGRGIYKGKSFSSAYSDTFIYSEKNDFYLAELGMLKIIATSQSFKPDKEKHQYIATENDAQEAMKKARKHLLPKATKMIVDKLKKQKRTIEDVKQDRIAFIKAVDLDGNDKKDIVGEYDIGGGSAGNNTLFVLWDTGKIESFAYDLERDPAFNMIDTIDIDGDSVDEIIFQLNLDKVSEYEDDEGYQQVLIFKHKSSGWKQIYRTAARCGDMKD